MWYASADNPAPQTSAYILAPLDFACSYSSKTIHPPPSPNTKPSLSKSNGLDAVFGSSFLVERARTALNPPIPYFIIPASEPPETIISE